jgi:predicted enzyme involved in methoxymalonyl-ACP biosynthesis
MEFAMMDELVRLCLEQGVTELHGHYYPTKKNGMVRDFYKAQGFQELSQDEEGNSEWVLDLTVPYQAKQDVIKVNA